MRVTGECQKYHWANQKADMRPHKGAEVYSYSVDAVCCGGGRCQRERRLDGSIFIVTGAGASKGVSTCLSEFF